MKLLKDAEEFGDLSTQYREAVSDGHDDRAKEIMKDIKTLVYFNAERLRQNFRLELKGEALSISKRRGVMIPALTIQNKLSRGDSFSMRDVVTFDPHVKQKMTGINMMLDYSGSMWFPKKDDMVGGKVQRIYAQNFFALTLAVYIELVGKGKNKILITPFCQTALIQDFSNGVFKGDWDTLIVHERWCSGIEINKTLMPKEMKSFDKYWCQNEHPLKAYEQTFSVFRRGRYTGFVNLFITDGGISRLGETGEDTKEFLMKTFAKINQIGGKNSQNAFVIIKEQRRWTRDILESISIKYGVFNSEEEFDNSFGYITNLLNRVVT